ncbi:hypothetical protein J2W91_005423 [Paenibacillus amylolyticus]|uniref:Lipoprotein n=1 Tax=Paenibacillus amylolyticus TaxID=1451 RepID=A0AAP5H8U7_PAEAM|nr:hypothetical protein [Paenibacillus amylolyticus]MDR6726898.1 hypothetical protein [Paenibacillus amylolyticus]
MKRVLLVILLICITFSIIGCLNRNKSEIIDDGIVIGQTLLSLGGENSDITEVTYSINLQNKLGKPITIIGVEPVISKDLSDRLIDNSLRLEVNKVIESNESKDISGYFKIDTKGLSKQEIMNFDLAIRKYKIQTEQLVRAN